MKNRILFTSILGALFLAPQYASSESCADLACSGAGGVDLTLNVTIPAFISLQVGDTTNIPVVNFDFTGNVAAIGNSVVANSTSSTNNSLDGGALGAGQVEVAVRANTAGATGVQLTVNLTDGGAGNIRNAVSAVEPEFAEFNVATAGANIAHPGATLVHGTTTNFIGSAVRNLTDTWTYTYDNTKVLAAGTYSGTVTYTLANY